MSEADVRHHRWHIDEREIERHRVRRGRRHAFESLDAPRTALVVVDMVPFFAAGSPFVRGIVQPINDLAVAVRAAGSSVAWVVPEPEPHAELAAAFYGHDVARSYASSGCTGEEPRSRLLPTLQVHDDDLAVTKTAFSAFFPGRCELHDRLQQRAVDTVLIAGTAANVCCESSARDARTLGYRVVMIADAVAAPTNAMVNATLTTVYRSFGDVRTAAEVTDLLRRSG